jgi:ligand-binding sensor domain-containing protein
MLVDHAGQLWLGIDNGLYTYSNGRFTSILTSGKKQVGLVESLTEDIDEHVWAEVHSVGTGIRRLVRIGDGEI